MKRQCVLQPAFGRHPQISGENYVNDAEERHILPALAILLVDLDALLLLFRLRDLIERLICICTYTSSNVHHIHVHLHGSGSRDVTCSLGRNCYAPVQPDPHTILPIFYAHHRHSLMTELLLDFITPF